MDEDDLIQRYFRPLTKGADGAFDLMDDAALMAGGGDHVVTKDVLVEGIHFRSDDPLDVVARKALRVNLSDLAAKGARPIGYFLGCVWPPSTAEPDIALFAAGLSADQAAFAVRLMGGDTTRSGADEDPLVISVTMIGQAPKGGPIRRAGAQYGDDLYVTGTIGDACLGLDVLLTKKSITGDDSFLIDRYRQPQPRVVLGGALAGVAHAALDVSDGLLKDADRLARACGHAPTINLADIPFSDPARAWIEAESDGEAARIRLASWGDDYEILFSAPVTRRRAVAMAANVAKTPITRIGRIERGSSARLIGPTGADITPRQTGYDHFHR